MSIERVITYDHSISTAGNVNVRKITELVEDGKVLSTSYHRHVVDAGTVDIEGEDERTKILVTALQNSVELVEDINEMVEDDVVTVDEVTSFRKKWFGWFGG